MLIKDHKIYEEFIDNVENDDLISDTPSAEPEEEHEIKYAIHATLRPNQAFAKMLKKAADSFFEVKYSEVRNYTHINLASDTFEFDENDKFGVHVCLLFDADFKSPKRAMRFLLAITRVFYMARKTIQITAESKTGMTMYALAELYVKAFLRPKNMLSELTEKQLANAYENMTYGLNVLLPGRYMDCMLYVAEELELRKSIPHKISQYYSNNKGSDFEVSVSDLEGNQFNQLSFEAKKSDEFGNEWLAIQSSILAVIARTNLYPRFTACFLQAGKGFAPNSGLRDDIQDKLQHLLLTVKEPHLFVTPYPDIKTARIVFSCFLTVTVAKEHPEFQNSGARTYTVYAVFRRMVDSKNFSKQLNLVMNELTDCFGLSLSQRKQLETELETTIKKEWA